ncbi:hypothetical protein V8F06_006629 [Rhypophila decipiens]
MTRIFLLSTKDEQEPRPGSTCTRGTRGEAHRSGSPRPGESNLFRIGRSGITAETIHFAQTPGPTPPSGSLLLLPVLPSHSSFLDHPSTFRSKMGQDKSHVPRFQMLATAHESNDSPTSQDPSCLCLVKMCPENGRVSSPRFLTTPTIIQDSRHQPPISPSPIRPTIPFKDQPRTNFDSSMHLSTKLRQHALYGALRTMLNARLQHASRRSGHFLASSLPFPVGGMCNIGPGSKSNSVSGDLVSARIGLRARHTNAAGKTWDHVTELSIVCEPTTTNWTNPTTKYHPSRYPGSSPCPEHDAR